MARDRGVLLSDRTTPCSSSWQNPLNFNSTSLSMASHIIPASQDAKSSQCVVTILGIEINTASFAMYTFSVSVLIQSLLIVSMSGAADHGVYRKTLLLVFAIIGALATMFFLAVVPKIYLMGAVLAIIANTCFGASFVLLNSFLPLLVRHHPDIKSHLPVARDSERPASVSRAQAAEAETNPNSSTPLLSGNSIPAHQNHNSSAIEPVQSISPELQLSTQISSNGIATGYIGAVILQIVSTFLIVVTGSTTFSLRLVLFITGLWWLIFTIPAALWLRPRPGPPLPEAALTTGAWFRYIVYAWKSLGRTVLRARRLKDVIIFLMTWFLLSDGIATVSGTAVLFAKTQLNMEFAALGLINVIAMIAGVCGAFLWRHLSRLFNLGASQSIIACICLFELIPIYGLLGFLPPIKRLGFFGLQQPWEMYALGTVYGLVMGGLSSYCRSFFGELIPPGFEASFYALYAITDKGSSIFGPAIVGTITDRYGEIRPAFGFLAILILIPLPLMLLVDVDRGKRDASMLAEELENKNTGHE